MKKFLGSLFFFFLFSVSTQAKIINFDKCWSPDEFKSFKHQKATSIIENQMFEIDLKKMNVIRTTIWSDDFVKKKKAMQNNNIKINANKIDQDIVKIKAYTKDFVTTKPLKLYSGDNTFEGTQEFVFYLKTGNVETTLKSGFSSTDTDKCDEY
ncbi:hypothetical protein [Candidatus Pelagibacter sp. HIMB1493]|uniref:hypothetical protein n=1 Tax=Candidatus Pelagibacter sp. HIMB1493 TaxID=3413334 RepID=UPI003F870896